MITNSLVKSSTEWPKSRKLIFFLCFIGLSYQLFQISREYYRYETEVKTKIIQPRDILDLPAITICTPNAVVYLKKSLRLRYPELNKTLALIDTANISAELKQLSKERIYLKYVYDDEGDDDRSENFFKNSIKDTDLIKCFLREPTILMLNKKWYLPYTDCSAIIPVLESKVQHYGKCFTYLSQQHSNIKEITDFQIKPTLSGILTLFLPFDTFEDAIDYIPVLTNKESNMRTHLFIHEGKSLPSFDPNDAIEIEPGKQYDISFWKTTKLLLAPPFDTDCYDYTKHRLTDSAKSNDQCLRHCHRDRSRLTIGCISNEPIVVNDQNFKNHKVKKCNDLTEFLISRRLMDQCIKWCKADCKQTQYHINSRKFDHQFKAAVSVEEKTSTKFSLVKLRYKGKGDMEYQYKPVHTFNESIWKMIITVLIWFGLSIFSFYTAFEMAFSKAKPHISTFDDKVSPNVIPVMPQSIPITPKFVPSQIGSNMKLEHYNNFIAQVVEGYPAQKIEMPSNKC